MIQEEKTILLQKLSKLSLERSQVVDVLDQFRTQKNTLLLQGTFSEYHSELKSTQHLLNSINNRIDSVILKALSSFPDMKSELSPYLIKNNITLH